MNPFDNVKAHKVSINGTTAIIEIDLNLYPQVGTKEAIDAGMEFYVQKHHPNIHRWEAKRQGNNLMMFVTGDINIANVLRLYTP